MEIPDVIKFVMDAGGPTVIAAIALVIVFKLVRLQMTNNKEIMDSILASQDASTEALTGLKVIMERSNDISDEVKTLLTRINGRA